MALNLAPQQNLPQANSYHGVWAGLLGLKNEAAPSLTEAGAAGSGGLRVFMQIAGIQGECSDKDHEDWIDVEEWESGVAGPTGGAKGPAATEATLEEILVVKRLDKSSPKLMESCIKRSVIPEVVIEVCRANVDGPSVCFYRYVLKDVMVTGFHSTGGAGDDVPIEEVSLNFREIKVTYKVIDSEGKPAGTVEFSWVVDEGKGARGTAK